MKLNIHNTLLAASALIVAASTSSCRKDLCYNHFPEAGVTLSYENEWERDYGMGWLSGWDADLYGSTYDNLRPGNPEGVTMVAYHPDGITEFYMSTAGGNVSFGASVHSLLFYNNDTQYIILNDMASLPSARATSTSRSRATLGELHAGERTINPPDVLYAAYSPEVPELKMHENVPLPVRLQPLVYTYVIRYEFDYGQQHVALARGAVAGMAESVYMRDGVTSDEAATILYDCTLTPYGARAEVASFGVPGFPDEYYGRDESSRRDTPRPYTLNLEVKLTNGTLKSFTFDITDQMQRQPRGGVIVVKDIRIEDDENLSDSGFDVDLEDWGLLEDIIIPVHPV
ncbi:DUF5119 domain-containing protein [uncultured Muribaculum sp.]|uniref:DUF5119 domain-containing protein n=1 Tax=uncultured Muribaculum sp. TaxID=1918613 RepID=UPI0025B6686F|nr:DUF5119 domain-containing protein [uncultured Muribaculum sp.]